MKIQFISAMLVLLTLVSFGQHSNETHKIDNLSWLCKTWERTNVKTGQRAYETWRREGDSLKGVGVTLQGSDTVFIEELSIAVRNDDLYYGAVVGHNPGPVYFKIDITGAGSFKSSNPKHDFPKEIMYELNDKDLTVIIGGDGKKALFKFRVVD
ncbi:MAG: hypothetical protein AAF149_18565 [Bacteroidota bacterium]